MSALQSDELSRNPEKLTAYADDVYFLEAWEDIKASLKSQRGSTEYSLRHLASLVIKPEAIVAHKAVELVELVNSAGFMPIAFRRFRFNRHTVRELWRYQLNIASDHRLRLIDRLLPSTDSFYVILADTQESLVVPASVRLSDLKGPTQPESRQPHHLRARLKAPAAMLLNFAHTADEPADLVREMGILFSKPERIELLDTAIAQQSVQHELILDVAAVCQGYKRHDLDLLQSLSRIEAAARNWLVQPETKQSLATIRKICERLRTRESGDWVMLESLLKQDGVVIPLWDLLVIGAETAPMSVPGKTPALEPRGIVPWLGFPKTNDVKMGRGVGTKTVRRG